MGPTARLYVRLLLLRPITAEPPVQPFGQTAVKNVLDVLNDEIYCNCVERQMLHGYRWSQFVTLFY